MSTRANVHFEHDSGTLEANVYRHSDGYPQGLGRDLERFLDDVQQHCKDTRFDDAEYLAAKFLVWQARQYAPSHPLDFLGVAPCIEDHGDIVYRYHVRCGHGHRPTVSWEKVDGSERGTVGSILRPDVVI